jgi:hypothetical protein
MQFRFITVIEIKIGEYVDKIYNVRFEVFMAERMMMFLWILAPCRLVERCHRFSPEDP